MRSDPDVPPAHASTSGYPRGAATLWLAVAVLSLLFVLLYAVFDALQADVGRLQAAVVAAQVVRVSEVEPEEIAALRAVAGRLGTTEDLLQSALTGGRRGGALWLAVMQQVAPVSPSEVQLTSLVQHEGTLTIRGTAAGAPALAAYAGRLQGSSLFSDVQIESAADTFAITLALRGYEP